MRAALSKILDILHLAEKLKIEKRHSWLSNGDQESVAEHGFRLALMVLFLAPHAKEPIDLKKALTMAICHDMPEMVIGDSPDFNVKSKADIEAKYQQEAQAMMRLCQLLKREDLKEIWEDFERKESPEARFVQALDRLESHMQHNESNVDTWLDIEKKRLYIGFESYCMQDPTLRAVAQMCRDESREKLGQEECKKLASWLESKGIRECEREVGIKGFTEGDKG